MLNGSKPPKDWMKKPKLGWQHGNTRNQNRRLRSPPSEGRKSANAERESKSSPESTEQKMEKLGQASSKNASASTRSQEDDCMNENGKDAETPKDPHQVRFHNRIKKIKICI